MSVLLAGPWTSGVVAAAPTGKTPSVDFHREVLPILARHCARCHTAGKDEGGLAIDDRKKLLAGGDSGPAVVVGESEKSLLIELVSGHDPDRVMPAEGRRLTADEIATLRQWIDQGAAWEEGLSLSSFPTAPWEPRRVELPSAQSGATTLKNPIDRLLAPYFEHHKIAPPPVVSDRVFIRRVYLDLVGLMPSRTAVEAFEKDANPEKRRALARSLLASRDQYAIHWLSFWNDALRNDYKGPGFIDGGRRQITGWLYRALAENKPFDRFVRELVAPESAESAGFVQGIVWRGVVNASQRPEMQAAQNVSQVFLGLNLKCASCHDSFVSQWKLDDAYALASVFAEQPLEVHRCDAPVKRFVEPRFLSPKLGKVDPKASLADRRKQLAEILVSPQDGRLARTIVNRLWARLLGRGLVEPVDTMDSPPWNADMLDFLATDLVDHKYDLQHTLELIVSSQAYQLPSVGATSAIDKDFIFRGPLVRRLSAEQLVDRVSAITGIWQTAMPHMKHNKGGNEPGGQLAAIGWKPPAAVSGEQAPKTFPDFSDVGVRAALADADPLLQALGRPNREQVVTSRETAATTLQVLELTNGTTLDRMLKEGARQWLKQSQETTDKLVEAIYWKALNRAPRPKELETARELVGSPASADGVQDLLWTLIMLPEFQLIE